MTSIGDVAWPSITDKMGLVADSVGYVGCRSPKGDRMFVAASMLVVACRSAKGINILDIVQRTRDVVRRHRKKVIHGILKDAKHIYGYFSVNETA